MKNLYLVNVRWQDRDGRARSTHKNESAETIDRAVVQAEIWVRKKKNFLRITGSDAVLVD